MKVALTVFKWAGMALSILAIPFSLALVGFPCIGLLVAIYSVIINAIFIAKHVKQQTSVKCGVLQCISIVGIPAGVIAILATSFNKKLLEKEAAEEAELQEAVEEVVDEAAEVAETVVDEAVEVIDEVVDAVEEAL